MNKEESKYFMAGIMQESVYRNPNRNLVKEKIKEIKEIMEKNHLDHIDFSVPLIVDYGVGNNWGELH